MIVCFPINEYAKHLQLSELAANRDGKQERLADLFPRRTDGRVLFGHPMKNKGFERAVRNRMELFRQRFGGEKSEPKALHGLFVKSLRRLAHAYGFADGSDLLSFTGTLQSGDICLAKGNRPSRYYLICDQTFDWTAHGMDLQIGYHEQEALNLSMAIFSAMTQVMQLFYLLDHTPCLFPMDFIPICSRKEAERMAQACEYNEFQYLTIPDPTDRALLIRHCEDGSEQLERVFDVKFALAAMACSW